MSSQSNQNLEIFYIIVGSFFGTYSLTWTTIEVSDWFGITFTELKAFGALGHYLLILHALIITLIIFLVRNHKKKLNESCEDKVQEDEYSAEESSHIDLMSKNLISAIKNAVQQERFEEVIRFGTALNRPLFVSGMHTARLEIGEYVEEAAANSDKKIQAEMLIDAIGWSYVEIGNLSEAEEKIKYGLSLSKEHSYENLTSRAYRHLGAIERRRSGPPDYGKAEEYFNKALEHAKKIPSDLLRFESKGGCSYAIASLNFHQKKFGEAITNLELAIREFTLANDNIGITRSLTKKANAEIALGNYSEAKDLLRKSLERAKKFTHLNQVVRSSIGLTEIYIIEKEWDKALKYLNPAKKIAQKMNVMNEIKEIVVLESKIPQKYIEQNANI